MELGVPPKLNAPNQGPNEKELKLREVSPSPPLTVARAPAPLLIPRGWRIEGLPGTVREAGPSAERRLLEFFTAKISNPHTRLAYSTAAARFFAWCETRNLALRAITPFAVAAYVDQMQDRYTLPTIKQHLSALRALLDYLVVGQVLPANPAAPGRGPKHVVKQGKTPVLSAAEARTLPPDRLPAQRRYGRKRPGHRCPRVPPHHQALRPHR